MEGCVERKAFYEKLELLKQKSQSKFTVYIDQVFYNKAETYLESLEDPEKTQTT